jgi:hypothetical protein
MSEELVLGVDAYFPNLRILEQDSESLNRNLHWYAAYAKLETWGEAPMSATSSQEADLVRFTWLGAFGEALFIRVQRAGEAVNLVSNADPRKHLIKKRLTQEDWSRLMALSDQSDLYGMAVREGTEGIDGGWWILEIRRGHRRWHAERWSPEGPYRAFCDRLTELAGSPQKLY